MPRPTKQFALIWWLSSGQTDIVSLSSIPKKHRQVNAIATLVWKNFKTKTETKEDAKVIAISSDENELYRQIITSRREIHDPSRQIFSADVLNTQKTISKNNTSTKNIKRSVEKIVEKIRKSQSIYDTENDRPKFLHKLVTSSILDHDVNHVSPSLSSCTTKFNSSQCDNSDNSNHSCQTLQCYLSRVTSKLQSDCTPIATTSANLFSSSNIILPQKPNVNHVSQSTSNYISNQSTSDQILDRTQNKITSSIKTRDSSDEEGNFEKSDNEESSEREREREVFNSDSLDTLSLSKSNNNVGAGIFCQLELGMVTDRDIYFQKQLLKAMIASRENRLKMNINSEKRFPIPHHYFEEGNEKVEIAPNCGFYLPKTRASLIELEAESRNDWKILVRETLLDVYGASIVNYSATGKRGSRPGIDYKLFKGLYEWVNQKSSQHISTKMLIDYINKLASNKRKYQKCTESYQKKEQVKQKKMK